MFQKNNYLSGTTSERKNRTYNNIPQIIKSNTARVNAILIDTSDISEASFNPDSNEYLYTAYPAIADELEKTMSKEKPIRLGIETEDEEKIESLIALNFDFEGMKNSGLSISGSERLNSFDRTVLDAITSLCIKGNNKYLTANMIFHVMAGRNDKSVSQFYAEEICNSITKLMFSHIIIRDWNNELNDFNILPANWTRAKLNGYEADCIHVNGKLSMFVYADYKSQIHEIDLELVRKTFCKNSRAHKSQMELLHFLLRKIISLKKPDNSISYETIYHELGYEDAARKSKFRLRQSAKKILDSWKGANIESVKLIDCKENKKGNIPCEITIIYRKVKKAPYNHYNYYNEYI